MTKGTLETTDELLEDVTDIVNDKEAAYKIRSARQMLVLAKEHQNS
mgnify:CR=1 FL=1